MSRLIRFILPKSVSNYFKHIQDRINRLEETVNEQKRLIRNLEFSVETLISSPNFIFSEDIGMNWQTIRKEIVNNIINKCGIEKIVETGTFIGNTTAYLQMKYNLPVYTCELNNQFYLLAKSRLKGMKDIFFHDTDSRSFLESLTKNELVSHKVFFYLDAHWYNDLPLRDEIVIIAKSLKNFVILVDDFEVPGDTGYGYDDYGNGKILNLEYIQDLLEKFQITPFFPSESSDKETGSKRGCVVLAPKGKMTEDLVKIMSLKQFHDFS